MISTYPTTPTPAALPSILMRSSVTSKPARQSRQSRLFLSQPPVASDFHLLATLQLALHTLSSTELAGGRNTSRLRAQGKLCITFALREHTGTDVEKLRVAGELEACVDRVFFGGEYRRRVYELGGILAADGRLLRRMVDGGVGVEGVALGTGTGAGTGTGTRLHGVTGEWVSEK